jgi:hypothetical protein
MKCEHDWQHVGGVNSGCYKDCDCSVPLYQCSHCKDYDYGDNEEAVTMRENCTVVLKLLSTPW